MFLDHENRAKIKFLHANLFGQGGRWGCVSGRFGSVLVRFPGRFTSIELRILTNLLRKWSGAGFREAGLGCWNAFLGNENRAKIKFLHANLFGQGGDRVVFREGLEAFWCDFRVVTRP